MRIDLVTVPYRYDERGEGLGAGPDALLAAGPLETVAGRRYRGGWSPRGVSRSRSARTRPHRPNIGRLGADTARLVAEARRSGDGALVLAGDDTAAIGVVSGLQQAAGAGAGSAWSGSTPTAISTPRRRRSAASWPGCRSPSWPGWPVLFGGKRPGSPPDRDRPIVLTGTRDLDEKETSSSARRKSASSPRVSS